MAAHIANSRSNPTETLRAPYAAAMADWARTLEEFALPRRIQGINFSCLSPFYDVETAEMKSRAGMLEGSAIDAQDNAVDAIRIRGDEDARGTGDEEGLNTVRDRGFFFRSSGNIFYIAGFGEQGHFNRLKGYPQIAALIRATPNPVSMLELDMATLDERITHDVRSVQPMADSSALAEYRERLAKLESEIAKARANNDSASTDCLEIEKAKLMDHLVSVSGVGGKSRDLNSLVDKLRPKIFGTINTAIRLMREAKPSMPLVAAHFEASITSEGDSFAYRVLNNRAPAWELS